MIRKLPAAVAVAAAVVIASCQPAVAQAVAPDAPVGTYLTLNNTVVLLATGLFIPLINGLLLRDSNPVWVKALVANLFGTAVHALSQVVQADGTAVLSQEWLLGLGITLGVMTVSYLGLWKPVVDPNLTMPTLVPATHPAPPAGQF